MFSAGTNPYTKQKLYDLLDQVTDAEVLTLHTHYQAAADKQAFYAEFETTSAAQTQERNLFIFEKWTHYLWVRVQLGFLGYQKEKLIERENYNAYVQSAKADEPAATLYKEKVPPHVLYNPAHPETVDAVIQMDAINKVSIADSIAKLRQIRLQLVGTEHPTDPLSQEAHDTLSYIAKEWVKSEPDLAKIQEFITKLSHTDAIPQVRREVNEEVSRDKEATAIRFYDNLPVFVDTIFAAYKKYYGAVLAAKHTEIIWQALEGGKQPDGTMCDPITADASWAAGDCEGNPNIDPPATSVAVTENRKKGALKHVESIMAIQNIAKNIERELRKKTIKLHQQKFSYLLKISKDDALLLKYQEFHVDTAALIADRNFKGLSEHYLSKKQELIDAITTAVPSPTQTQQEWINSVNATFEEQTQYAQQLEKLTLFSGSFVDENRASKPGEKLNQGALEKYVSFFEEIIRRVDDNKNSSFIKENNLPVMLKRLDEIIENHAEVLRTFGDIAKRMRHFRLQLISFGMALGYMHLRQDSTVFMRIWNEIFIVMQPGRGEFKKLTADQQAQQLEKLIDGSPESNKFLADVYQGWKTQNFTAFPEVSREMDRMELALNNPDIFEIWILSNTATLANILSLYVFRKMFPFPDSQLRTVPLLENLDDLNNAPVLLEQYIRIIILDALQQDPKMQVLVAHLRTLSKEEFKLAVTQLKDFIAPRVQGMFGYSDSERGSGLSALLPIDIKQEECIKLCKEYGIPFWIFDGAGNDLFRGGSHLARRKQIFTGQGVFRDTEYGTDLTANILRETQFANEYMRLTHGNLQYTDLTSGIRQQLDEFCKKSSGFFESYLDVENGYGGLVGKYFALIKYVVELANQSSRGNVRAFTQNGLMQKNHSDRTRDLVVGNKEMDGWVDPVPLRAIGAAQLYEMLRLYSNIIIGPGRAMREMDKYKYPQRYADQTGVSNSIVKSLYFLSPAFQDIYEKMLYGFAAVNLEITLDACFGARKQEFRPVDDTQRAHWQEEAKQLAGKYTKERVEELMMGIDGKEELLIAMSRLFILIEDEFYQTRDFLLKMNKIIFAEKYRENPLVEFTDNTDLLHHNPSLKAHLKDVYATVEPLNQLLARISNHLKNNKKLASVYHVNPDTKVGGSELSIYARILGNVACGILSSRTLLLTVDVQRPVEQGQLRARAESRLGLFGDKGIKTRLEGMANQEEIVNEEKQNGLALRN